MAQMAPWTGTLVLPPRRRTEDHGMKYRLVVAFCLIGAFLIGRMLFADPITVGEQLGDIALEHFGILWYSLHQGSHSVPGFDAQPKAPTGGSAVQTQPATATIPFAGTLSFQSTVNVTVFVKPVNSAYLSLHFGP